MNTIIQTVTGDLEKCFYFYQKLNFTQVSEENDFLFSDGKVFLEIIMITMPDRVLRFTVPHEKMK
jgi:hypothetical protein